MLLAVTGLGREARIVSQPGIVAISGGGNAAGLRAQIRIAVKDGADRVLSVGICGALAPSLKVGDCIVATEIIAGNSRFTVDRAWSELLLARVPSARPGAIAGSEKIVATADEKERLYRATNATAVDMESHVAAATAQELGLPFAALRIVSDSSRTSLPPAAIVGMSPDGKVDVLAVLRSLVARPSQLPALLRTAWDAEKAFRVLLRCRHVLAPSLAAVNLGELSLDVG